MPTSQPSEDDLNIITINSIRGRTKPPFYRASVLKYKFDSHGERTKTTVNFLDDISQRAITKEKTLEYIQIFKYIHHKHNQRESKASFQSSKCARSHKTNESRVTQRVAFNNLCRLLFLSI